MHILIVRADQASDPFQKSICERHSTGIVTLDDPTADIVDAADGQMIVFAPTDYVHGYHGKQIRALQKLRDGGVTTPVVFIGEQDSTWLRSELARFDNTRIVERSDSVEDFWDTVKELKNESDRFGQNTGLALHFESGDHPLKEYVTYNGKAVESIDIIEARLLAIIISAQEKNMTSVGPDQYRDLLGKSDLVPEGQIPSWAESSSLRHTIKTLTNKLNHTAGQAVLDISIDESDVIKFSPAIGAEYTPRIRTVGPLYDIPQSKTPPPDTLAGRFTGFANPRALPAALTGHVVAGIKKLGEVLNLTR